MTDTAVRADGDRRRWPDAAETRLALAAAAERVRAAKAELHRREGEFEQLARRANAVDNPHRLGIRTIAGYLDRDGMTLYERLYGHPSPGRPRTPGSGPGRTFRDTDRAPGQRERCHAVAAHTGMRCRALARPGERTCFHHRDVPASALVGEWSAGDA
jgi:hypothetical protein